MKLLKFITVRVFNILQLTRHIKLLHYYVSRFKYSHFVLNVEKEHFIKCNHFITRSDPSCWDGYSDFVGYWSLYILCGVGLVIQTLWDSMQSLLPQWPLSLPVEEHQENWQYHMTRAARKSGSSKKWFSKWGFFVLSYLFKQHLQVKLFQISHNSF